MHMATQQPLMGSFGWVGITGLAGLLKAAPLVPSLLPRGRQPCLRVHHYIFNKLSPDVFPHKVLKSRLARLGLAEGRDLCLCFTQRICVLTCFYERAGDEMWDHMETAHIQARMSMLGQGRRAFLYWRVLGLYCRHRSDLLTLSSLPVVIIVFFSFILLQNFRWRRLNHSQGRHCCIFKVLYSSLGLFEWFY